MYKNISEIDIGKLMRVITAAYDESAHIKDADQFRNHLAQFSNELSEVAEGLSTEDALIVHHKGFETLEQFKKDPVLRLLFK